MFYLSALIGILAVMMFLVLAAGLLRQLQLGGLVMMMAVCLLAGALLALVGILLS